MEQYNNNKGRNNKYITKRLDSKSDIKRKYKLIIEEEYIYMKVIRLKILIE